MSRATTAPTQGTEAREPAAPLGSLVTEAHRSPSPVRWTAGLPPRVATALRVGASWDPQVPGVLVLPSGRLVRGRAMRGAVPSEHVPDVGLYLVVGRPASTPWPSRWLRWPDLGLPSDRGAAIETLRWAWRSAQAGRVEVACSGGVGRTGTALACLALLDGVPPRTAVDYVRAGDHPRAVEMPWQRRYVERFGANGP